MDCTELSAQSEAQVQSIAYRDNVLFAMFGLYDNMWTTIFSSFCWPVSINPQCGLPKSGLRRTKWCEPSCWKRRLLLAWITKTCQILVQYILSGPYVVDVHAPTQFLDKPTLESAQNLVEILHNIPHSTPHIPHFRVIPLMCVPLSSQSLFVALTRRH